MIRPTSLPKLEEEAYYAVLRALAVNQLDWEKERLLTDLRSVLNISNDQHFKFLEEVMDDKLVNRLKNTKPSSDVLTTANARMSQAPLSTTKRQKLVTPPVSKTSTISPSSGRFARKIRTAPPGKVQGRGKRISGFGREALQKNLSHVLKSRQNVPFGEDYFASKLNNATILELEEMENALLIQDQFLIRHMQTIDQLEDSGLVEFVAASNPDRFGHLLIEELECADQRLTLEIDYLQDDDTASVPIVA